MISQNGHEISRTARRRLNLQFFAEPAGGAGGEGATGASAGDPAGAAGNVGTAGETNPVQGDQNAAVSADNGQGTEDAKALAAQLEQLKADIAKQKAALDKATKEAGDAKKALKARMTQEEIDAANKKEAEEKAAQELEELRRKVSKAENTKSVMGKLALDEETAGQIAESMAGCEDIETALLLIQKAWTAKEKALRLEFGKIPGPGSGGGSEDKEMQAALELAREMGENRAKTTSSVRDQLKGLVR